MPRLPIRRSAETVAGSVLPGLQGLQDITEQLLNFKLAVDRQQDEMDLVRSIGEFESGSFDIRQQILSDPEIPLDRKESEFSLRARLLQTDITKKFRSGFLLRAFNEQVERTLPSDLIKFRAGIIGEQTKQQVAELREARTDLATRAAVAEPADRDRLTATHRGLLDRALARGVIDATTHQSELTKFKQETLTENMDFYRRTNRAVLYELDRAGAFRELDPIQRLKTLEQARIDADQEEARQEKVHRAVVGIVERQFSAKANLGSLPETELEEALRGENPYISPDKAREYAKINQNPPTGQGALQVRTLMQEYYSKASTLDNIAETREALNRLSRELGRPNPLVIDALRKLQADQRTMESIGATKLNVESQQAIDEYTEETKPPTGIGFVDRKERARGIANKAEIRRRVREGEPRKKVVEEILGRRKRRIEAEPESQKTKNFKRLLEE